MVVIHMKKITLFDDKVRTLEGPALHNSDTYSYLNDSSRTDVENVRKLLEHWFEMYPDNEKEELRNKFKVDFYPTEYELYIYALFTLLGYKLEIHPKLNHTDK